MIKDFLTSISNYINAIRIIQKLKLWKFFLVPALIGFVLGMIFIVSAWSFSDEIGGFISGFWKWDFAKRFITKFSEIIGGFFVLIIGIILYKHLLMALSAPFMTPVSEKVETYLTEKDYHGNHVNSSFIEQLIRSLRLNIRNLIVELMITLPLMILSLIPVVGLVATFFIFYYQSYYTGFGNMDYTLERHLNYKESQEFVKKYKGIAIGNGLVFTLMLFIPFIGIMLTLPIATVASTVSTIKKLHSEDKIVMVNNL